MSLSPIDRDRSVELAVRAVYDECPPTVTHHRPDDGQREYSQFWRGFLTSLGVPPAAFENKHVLDVGCGSCEKTSLYADWGAHVTGLDMTPAVLEHARRNASGRDVTLVQSSLFDFEPQHQFDIVISDGVLHHCADTLAALKRCASLVAPGGTLVIGLVNVWGGFWWFKPARGLCRLLAPRDFHRRAMWGTRLFGWTRSAQEGDEDDAYRRSQRSWAYDWFANPRWNTHRPETVLRWLSDLGFDHRASSPSLVRKAAPTNSVARMLRALTGAGGRMMALYWLATRQPNMFYFSAVRRG